VEKLQVKQVEGSADRIIEASLKEYHGDFESDTYMGG
jgi:hypothetical protein